METIELNVRQRAKLGTGPSRALRRSGQIPAVLYGHGMAALSLEINARDFQKILHTKAGANAIIRLHAENVELKENTCLIKDIQHDPVTEEVEHVDFTLISLTEKIRISVQVVVKNGEDAPGVKEGGALDVLHYELEVECLPTEIPENFTVDAKNMKINDLVYIKDLKAPEGVNFILDPEEVVVALHPPRKDETAPAAEEVTQPEVIEKGKKPEAEGEEAAKDAKA